MTPNTHLVYALLDEDHNPDTTTPARILHHYFTTSSTALHYARQAIQLAYEDLEDSTFTIEPIEEHYETSDGYPRTDTVGYSLCTSDGTPVESISIYPLETYHD